jgi:hypothetical protein
MFYPNRYGSNKNYPSLDKFQQVYLGDLVGKGIICLCAFKKGDLVAEITGDIVSKIMLHTIEISPSAYLLDRYFSGYFLHSCYPNISVNMQTMLVTALRDIKVNEYLYMDYAKTEDVRFRQFKCHCDSSNCQGWVTGRQENIKNYNWMKSSNSRTCCSGQL